MKEKPEIRDIQEPKFASDEREELREEWFFHSDQNRTVSTGLNIAEAKEYETNYDTNLCDGGRTVYNIWVAEYCHFFFY